MSCFTRHAESVRNRSKHGEYPPVPSLIHVLVSCCLLWDKHSWCDQAWCYFVKHARLSSSCLSEIRVSTMLFSAMKCCHAGRARWMYNHQWASNMSVRLRPTITSWCAWYKTTPMCLGWCDTMFGESPGFHEQGQCWETSHKTSSTSLPSGIFVEACVTLLHTLLWLRLRCVTDRFSTRPLASMRTLSSSRPLLERSDRARKGTVKSGLITITHRNQLMCGLHSPACGVSHSTMQSHSNNVPASPAAPHSAKAADCNSSVNSFATALIETAVVCPCINITQTHGLTCKHNTA